MSVNVENINKVIAMLRKEDVYFNMRDWTNCDSCGVEYPENICGTPSCIGGWAEAIMAFEGATHLLNGDTPTNVVGDWLGVEEPHKIFYPGSLDSDNADPYNATKQQAIRLLENLIETGKVDWDYAMAEEVNV